MMSQFFIAASLICHYFSLVCCLNEEGSALLSFKQSVKNFRSSNLNNWNSSDSNPCSWIGITCKEEKVVSLTIVNRRLVGPLPSALGKLPAIRHIDLRDNRFYGSLPVDIFNISGLQSLVLSGNSLSGSIPNEVGNLRLLQTLDLSKNSFSGSVPSSILGCKKLKLLALNQNNFTGVLPKGLAESLLALHKLNLSFNRLSGSIPVDIGKLSNLKGVLDLSHNLLSGRIPTSLGSLPEEIYIDLSYNNLSGRIPQNGALLNLGPTAFLGNPLLCGPPLKILCSAVKHRSSNESSFHFPSRSSHENNIGKKGNSSFSRKGVVAAVVAGSFMGLCLAALIYSYRRNKVCACKKDQPAASCNERELAIKRELGCFRKGDPRTLSAPVGQYVFVPLDLELNFDLEELLRASAFILGKGSIGIMYKVVLENGTTVAVRRLGDGGSQRLKEFQTEVEAIGKIRHPNIASLRAYCWSADEKLLIYDYMPNGDLAAAIHGKAGMISVTPLSWPVRLKIIRGIARGLVYLHESSLKRYVHGDLRPSKILLGQDMEPHISGFGLGRVAFIAEESMACLLEQVTIDSSVERFPGKHARKTSLVIPRSYYQAPEASRIIKPSQKWDVYSFGVILLETISGKSPVMQIASYGMDIVGWMKNSIQQQSSIFDVVDPFLVNDLDMEEEIVKVLNIGLACAHQNPEKRPPIRNVFDILDRLAGSTC